ncbi:sialate:O-sulfotransferase 2-like [Saccoglossus kowalevskii]|uniref:WSC domain-containing protein 2-like n=1 Tax=Saccoglossus kowalevskii TaxID=10224 RepID=A0ABM0MKF2_SACKO|nr:PREDICTED: WSC domain-containing protein 2-like [Saccoglossus kowalevskii]
MLNLVIIFKWHIHMNLKLNIFELDLQVFHMAFNRNLTLALVISIVVIVVFIKNHTAPVSVELYSLPTESKKCPRPTACNCSSGLIEKVDNCTIDYGNWLNGSRDMVGLTSFPRSGNTWTRHLLEVATGIYTGSLYNAAGLYAGGFVGEIDDPSLGRAVVYKSHGYSDRFASGILIIRNPYDSLISFYLFKKYGFMGNPTLTIEVFKNNADWIDFFHKQRQRWLRLLVTWVESKKRFLIVHYEDLSNNPLHHLNRMLRFLNLTLTSKRLACVQTQLEGRYHRNHTEYFTFDPYNEEMHKQLDEDIMKANTILHSLNSSNVHKPAYDLKL